jgi:hypothetical protein
MKSTRMRRLVADPAYISHKIFSEDLAAIHSVKSKLKLNRPIYVGQAVLDLSKHRMYNFWYNHLKRIYGEKVQLLYTDTDSLLYKVETENVYEDMRQHAEEYDFSDYPKDHPCYSVENKKVVGKFKDECLSRAIAEFVGLRPKMYSISRRAGATSRRPRRVQDCPRRTATTRSTKSAWRSGRSSTTFRQRYGAPATKSGLRAEQNMSQPAGH